MSKRGSLGTSLIELLTTLAIIAVLVAMSISAYAWAVPWVKEKLGLK